MKMVPNVLSRLLEVAFHVKVIATSGTHRGHEGHVLLTEGLG